MLVVLNATPSPLDGYRIGVPTEGTWRVLLDSDDEAYGGSGFRGSRGAGDESPTSPGELHGHDSVLELTVGPLSALLLHGPAT